MALGARCPRAAARRGGAARQEHERRGPDVVFVVRGVPEPVATVGRLRVALTPERTRWPAFAALADRARVGRGPRTARGTEAAGSAVDLSELLDRRDRDAE
ncbi:hypothetical protein [Streptomyces malaysiense]|uniref:Uncharacterized protein n=1 Tax=Streptomyces malaysiense TaxID=1428626 RepID=A0A1J4Q5J8_9ACTN|nr:hypothetical protein [Streptomyces malaysiense]OIK27820.1 hypothetical protein VT52_009395 [Streptomyces malaysiense]